MIASLPGPIVLVPSRAKWWLVMLGSGLMTTASVLVIWLVLSSSDADAGIGLAFGIVGVVFFGAVSAVNGCQP